MDVSDRLHRWVSQHFEPAVQEQVLNSLRDLSEDQLGRQDAERIQAALVLASAGRWDWFVAQRELLNQDWRDVLMNADLGRAGWSSRLDEILGAS